jgi:spore maturation protein SpmB
MENKNNAATVQPKKGGIDAFMIGARKGFNLGMNQVLPAMVLGFVLVQFLQITGISNIIGIIFTPILKIFGLPGEAAIVLISAFFAKAAGAATAASLYADGVINAAQATILLMPCMLMGTLVGHYARIVLVAGTQGKYRLIMLAIPIIDSILGMFLMKIILTFMGLM